MLNRSRYGVTWHSASQFFFPENNYLQQLSHEEENLLDKIRNGQLYFFSFVKEDKSLAISWGQGAVSTWVDNLSCVFIIIISFFLSFFFFKQTLVPSFLKEIDFPACTDGSISETNIASCTCQKIERKQNTYVFIACIQPLKQGKN